MHTQRHGAWRGLGRQRAQEKITAEADRRLSVAASIHSSRASLHRQTTTTNLLHHVPPSSDTIDLLLGQRTFFILAGRRLHIQLPSLTMSSNQTTVVATATVAALAAGVIGIHSSPSHLYSRRTTDLRLLLPPHLQPTLPTSTTAAAIAPNSGNSCAAARGGRPAPRRTRPRRAPRPRSR